MNSHTPEIIRSTDLAEGDSIALLSDAPDNADTDEAGQFFGTVVEARPRSVRIELEAVRGATRRLWLPRRALVKLKRDRSGVRGQLARWWIPDDYQAGILNRCQHVSGAGATPSTQAGG